MSLREQLGRDLAVFLNLEEFGEELVVTLDGHAPVTVTAVRTDEDTAQRTQGPPQIEGVFTRHTTLHLRADDLAARPVESQRLALGSGASLEYWFVTRVDVAEGLLEIALERQET